MSCITESRRDQEGGGELDSHEEVIHFLGPGEIKRREMVLDPQVSPDSEEIKSREAGCYGHCLCGSVPTPFVDLAVAQRQPIRDD